MVIEEKVNVPITKYQSHIWDHLTQITQSGLVGNGYVFSGPSGCGKEGISLAFAQFLNCENPTEISCGSCSSCFRYQGLQNEKLKLVVPLPAPKSKQGDGDGSVSISGSDLDLLTESIQAKSKDPFYKIRIPRAQRILIQSIRELRKSLYLKDSTSGQKVVIIFDAHLLSVGQGEAANALLKILEEPPSNTTIILVTDHQSLMLPTILSRCQLIQFPPLIENHIHNWLKERGCQNDVSLLASLSQGNVHRAKMIMKQPLDDVLDNMNSFIQKLTSTDTNVWRKFTQEYGRMAFQKPEEIKFQFQMATLWLHGAYHLRNGVDLPIHGSDLKNNMDTFNKNFPNCDCQGIVLLLDGVIESMAMNFHMPLILINLLLDIQKKLNK